MPSLHSKQPVRGPDGLFRDSRRRPRLTARQIVEWAKKHRKRTGSWPTRRSGPIDGAPGVSWLGVNSALKRGYRGLPRGESLAQLLHRHVGRPEGQQPIRIPHAQILEWADAYHRKHGRWPSASSGPVAGTGAPGGMTWSKLDTHLIQRSHPGRESLAKLVQVRRGESARTNYILKWADAYHRKHGRWPRASSGPVAGPGSPGGMTWSKIDTYLTRNGRPGRESLAKLLQARRGESGRTTHPPFKLAQVVAWAKAFHRRNGRWPRKEDPDPNSGWHWSVIDYALYTGRVRGIPAGTTIAVFLFRRCGAPYQELGRSPISVNEVLTWADRHHRRTGRWPTKKSGRVAGAPKELTWAKVDGALLRGGRGLPKEKSLPQLLMRHRGARHSLYLPTLSVDQILAWADAYHKRCGRWPTRSSGTVLEAPENTWSAIHFALKDGGRGLPGGSSLWALFRRKRDLTRWNFRPTLTQRQVLGWAVAHHRRTGAWPTHKSGVIKESPGDTWLAVDIALRHAIRGFPKKSSLSRILDTVRGNTVHGKPTASARKRPLNVREVQSWAKAHARRTGSWPDKYGGRISVAKGETWFGIGEALRLGLRRLPKVKSLGSLFSGLPKPRALALGRGEAKVV